MHHLIVRQRQNEIFIEGIQESKGQLVMVILPVDGIFGHEDQGVVHPAHIPLHTKAETAHIGRPGNHGPGS